jgi:3-oxoacyl-[acyl-carrier protein] reductase
MDLGLKGRTAIVCGASSGMGLAIAERLTDEGANVAMFARRRDVLEREAERLGALAVRGDVTSPRDLKKLVEQTLKAFGGIDVLVNNAGGLVKRVPVAEFTDELFDEVLQINARSMLAFCRDVVPVMRAQGRGGSIINVTSVAARHGGGPGAFLYAGSKGFVSTATRGLAKELVGDRIRVNAVAPGVIQTPFHDRYSTPQMLEGFKATIPMARIGTPEECVGAFLFLASETLSGYVTGQIIEVNGGQYMP